MIIVFFYAVLGGMKGITYTQVAQYCVLIFAFTVPAIFISLQMVNSPIPQLGMGGQLEDGTYSNLPVLIVVREIIEDLVNKEEKLSKKEDKKTELMVLTSTSHVAPHIAGCISSVVIYLVQVALQMVLISTVSTFFLSFLSSSFSCLDLLHKDSTRLSASALYPANSRNDIASHARKQTRNFSAQRPDRTARSARRGGGRWAAARSSGNNRGGEGEKQIEVAALKSTGSRRRAHRSASTARAASRQCASCQLQPAAAP